MAEPRQIRLTVCCPNEAVRAAVAARVRGAAVEARPDVPPPAPGGAVMLVGLPPSNAGPLLAGGAHVLLAAEPVPDRGGLGALFAAARSAGVLFVAANPERYLPSRRLVRRQIPDPLGDPGLIRLHRWETGVGAPPDPLLRDLDVTVWLAGRRPDRVYAVTQDSGRYLQVHLGFPGGGMALLDYDSRLPPGDGYQSLSVIAANGAAYSDGHQNVQLAFRGGHPQAIRTDERAGQLAAAAQEFADAARAGRDLMTENEAGWRTAFAVADAVRESLATGRAVGVEGR